MNGNKVLLTIGGVFAIFCGACYCITIIGIILGVPLIIGGLAFLKYAKMDNDELLQYKGSILGWSIFFLIFTFISGILGLIFYLDNSNLGTNQNTTKTSNFSNQIKELDKLRQDGLISDEDYETKKKQILDIKE